jgi:hypothetical protein
MKPVTELILYSISFAIGAIVLLMANASIAMGITVPTSSGVYYEGLDWWGICNNSLIRSYISQPCETLVTPDHRALTSQGKIVLEGILCPKGPSILSTIELFYGPIPGKAKNELNIACGW